MGKKLTVQLTGYHESYRRFHDLPKALNEPDMYCPDMGGMRRYIDRLECEVTRLRSEGDEG